MAKSLVVSFLALCACCLTFGSVSPVLEQVRVLTSEVEQLKVDLPTIEQKLAIKLKLSEVTILELMENKVKTAVANALSWSWSRIRNGKARDQQMKAEIRRLMKEVATLKSGQDSAAEQASLLTSGLQQELNAAKEEMTKLKEDFSTFKTNFSEQLDRIGHAGEHKTEPPRVSQPTTVTSAPITMTTATSTPPFNRTRVLIAEYWSSTSSFPRQLNIHNNQGSTYSHLKTGRLISLAYDPTRNQILFSRTTPTGIYASPLDRKGVRTLKSNMKSHGMAVDGDRAILFLTTYEPTSSVSRMTTNGRNLRSVFDMSRKDGYPACIALDTANKIIYVTNEYRLMSMTYDGWNFQTLYTRKDDNNYISGVTLDERRRMLYFSHGPDMMRHSLSGGTSALVGTQDTHIWSVEYYNNTVYSSSTSNGNVHALFSLNGDDFMMTLTTGTGKRSVICLIP